VPFSRFRERLDASATFYAGAGFAGAALPSILSQPLAQPSKSSARRKCYVSERASNNSIGSGALGVVFPEIGPVCLQGNMRVSIIVPTLNEESHIVGTIRSLQRLSSEKEIIVVDGGSD
jgi:cellulose synthase/poly-beta-1,6-N-acetylglucosamine synthase-like glycosyltransferase